MALDGLERRLHEHFSSALKKGGEPKGALSGTRMISSLRKLTELLENEVKPLVVPFFTNAD